MPLISTLYKLDENVKQDMSSIKFRNTKNNG